VACAKFIRARIQLVFDRLAPARKEGHVKIKLPPINSLLDLLDAQSAIIQHAASSQLTPAEGHAMAGLLDLRRRAIESVELERRRTTIEARSHVQYDLCPRHA
jgi:hypothetical protein